MRNRTIPKNQTARRLPIARTALAMPYTALLSLADQATPPVPTKIQLPAGNKAFLQGHATGTQNYICLPAGPQASLFNMDDKQNITHFFSPNPDPEDSGAIRAAWQYRTSTVWAKPVQPSDDPDFVEPEAIPWLLLERKGSSNEPKTGFLGYGDQGPDIQGADIGTDDRAFSLRSERGTGGANNGRVYTITYQASDASGNKTETKATVIVPTNGSKTP